MNQLSPALSPWSVVATRVALGVAVFAAAALAAVAASRPHLWMVEHVLVTGAHRAEPATLRHLADVPNGVTPWRIDPRSVAEGVEAHPWVKSADAVVEWPDRVRIVVEEHRTAALLWRDGRLHAVSGDGTAFVEASRQDLDHPLLTGIDAELDSMRDGLVQLTIDEALGLLDGLETRGLVARDQVSQVAFSLTAGFTVHTRTARLSFALGGLERQLDRLSAMVQQGLDLTAGVHVDLAPTKVAILRPLPPTLPSPEPLRSAP